MSESEDPKKVTNSDLPNSQFGGGLINADIVNAQRIGGDIYNIHLGQQAVASSNPAPSPNQQQRSQQERDSLEKAYTLQSQRVDRIRNAWVIETDPSRKFQYEQQLQAESRTLKELGDKLDAFERQLQAAEKSELKANTGISFEQPMIEEETYQPLSRLEAIKHRELQKRLKVLEEDFESLYNQLNYTENAQSRNNLQRQLKVIEQDMKKVEVQLNELGHGRD